MLVAIFVVGYTAIVLEHVLRLNKSAAALVTGVGCWTAYVVAGDPTAVNEQLVHHLGSLSQILFFLLAAMTIVEIIDAHDGFELITARITTTSRRKLLVTIAVLSFFLSAVLDNLTTAIVMISLVRKVVADRDDRMAYGGVVIIAANAGGVWSPIGDVTTTMLWVGHQLTTTKMIAHLALPAVVSAAAPALWIGLKMRGAVRRSGGVGEIVHNVEAVDGATSVTLSVGAAAIGKTLGELDLRALTGASVVTVAHDGGAPTHAVPNEPLRVGDVLTLVGSADAVRLALDLLVAGEVPKRTSPFEQRLVFFAGVGALLFVPLFKSITHLPPVLGILLGLGVLWGVTERLHRRKGGDGRDGLSVSDALRRIDAESVLFFLGILLAISALESAGVLGRLSSWMAAAIGEVRLITLAIGLASSVVDNVPLVAAAQGMYTLAQYPTDHTFWMFLAFCAGTGGSILIIGSAAGIAVMGIERISFGQYVRRFSVPALLGYLAGALTFLATG